MKDAEEESAGVKKAAGGRGGTGSKRTRAAEVHNLSERVSKTYAYLCSINYKIHFPSSLSLWYF